MNLRTKILLFLILPVALIMVVVEAVNVLVSRKEMLANARAVLQVDAESAAMAIEVGNREAVQTARIVAATQEGPLFGRREETLAFMRRVLDENPQIVGIGIGYEPNADGADEAFKAAAGPRASAYTDASGRFLPYWVRDLKVGGSIRLEPLVDMDRALYYQGPRKLVEAGEKRRWLVTEPYVYNGLNLIVEQASAIVRDGRFVGIVGIDRSLDFLGAHLNKLRHYPSSQVFVISGRGRIVASTRTEDLRTLSIESLFLRPDGTFVTDGFSEVDGKRDWSGAAPQGVNTAYATTLAALARMRAGTLPLEDPVLGRCIAAAAPVPTGNWTLVVAVAESEVIAPAMSHLKRNLLIAGMGFGVALLIVVYFTSGLARRIASAAAVARRVAGGDLTKAVPREDAKDESGLLIRAIAEMSDTLARLLGRVRRCADDLGNTAERISAAATRQEGATQGFSASTSQVTVAVREISATSQELLSTVDGVAQSAARTTTLAESGRGQLQALNSVMERLARDTASISGRLAAISDKAKAINAVVVVISKVAAQTNLLSLNAAIEAEQAGTQGQGFGVVAREVRRLADQSAAATLDIERIVREMQSAVSAGVMEMDKFNDSVRAAVGDIGSLGERLTAIITEVESLTPRFETVREGVRAGAQGTAQITDAMVKLTDGARQTAQSLEDFRGAMADLRHAVQALREEMSQYQLPGTDGRHG